MSLTKPVVLKNGEVVDIDNYIVDIITFLDSRGVPTRFSCSGLMEDHPELVLEKYRYHGYIHFRYDDSLWKIFEDNAERFHEIDVVVVLTKYIRAPHRNRYLDNISLYIEDLDDEVVKSKWDKLLELFKEMF